VWVLLGFDMDTDDLVESHVLVGVDDEEARRALGARADDPMYDTYLIADASARAWASERAGITLSDSLNYQAEDDRLRSRRG
jgi:hypothetical protein